MSPGCGSSASPRHSVATTGAPPPTGGLADVQPLTPTPATRPKTRTVTRRRTSAPYRPEQLYQQFNQLRPRACREAEASLEPAPSRFPFSTDTALLSTSFRASVSREATRVPVSDAGPDTGHAGA